MTQAPAAGNEDANRLDLDKSWEVLNVLFAGESGGECKATWLKSCMVCVVQLPHTLLTRFVNSSRPGRWRWSAYRIPFRSLEMHWQRLFQVLRGTFSLRPSLSLSQSPYHLTPISWSRFQFKG
jgi:hypothetical protein